jgi:hypothetical protein
MAEENAVIEKVEPTIEVVENEVGAGFWGVSNPTPQPKTEGVEPIPASTSTETIVEKTEQADTKAESDTLDEDAYVKTTFGFDSADLVKQQLAELQTLKSNPQATKEEIKWANEQSKQIHQLISEGKTREVRKFLEAQERIEDAMSVNIDKDNAEDIIKLGMQLKYKDLSPQEINYKYNKEFSIPKEPIQALAEADVDFEERKSEWQQQVNDIQTSKIIEAKLVKPELEKLKSQIVLPDISTKNQPEPKQELSQEELAEVQKNRDRFIQAVDESLKSQNEFSITYKDEAVSIPVSYVYSAEEKSKVAEQLKAFVENNLDANVIFAPNWMNKDGTLNVSRMTSDLLRYNSKPEQKLVDDAVGKRMKQYTAEKKNIKLNTTTSQPPNGQVDYNKALEEVEGAIWNARR